MAVLLLGLSTLSIFGFISYRTVLDDLSTRGLPQIVTSAEVSAHLNELLYLTERLSSTQSGPVQRIAMSSIDTKFIQLSLSAEKVKDPELQGLLISQIKSLQTNLANLNDLVSQHIAAQQQADTVMQNSLVLLDQGRDLLSALDTDLSPALRLQWVAVIAQITELTRNTSSFKKFSDLRSASRRMKAQLRLLKNLAHAMTPRHASSFADLTARLQNDLMGPTGLVSSVEQKIRTSGRSAGRGNFARSMVEEVNSAFSSQFMKLNISVAQDTRELLSAVNFQILPLAGLAAFALLSAILVHFYFKRILTNRLLAVNTAVLQRVAGADDDIQDDGNDEISDIANSINYFARELRLAKEEAEASSNAKSQFLANVSHEVRTPLSTIMGMAFLAKQTQLTASQSGYMEKVDAAARHLLGVINDILAISKAEAGKMELEEIPFELDKLILGVVDILAPSATTKGLELLIDIHGAPKGLVSGDPLRLKQILINLVSNAIKFTEQGEVVVTLRVAKCEAGEITFNVCVKDTGIGITAKQQAKLFTSFHQADTTITRRFGGSGLGLAISRSLVNLMGSDMNMVSTPNMGSEFSFSLSLPFASFEIVPPTPIPGAVFEGKILVVDDNHSACLILESLVSSIGLDCICAASADEAIEKLRALDHAGTPSPLVLMDWKMPERNGLDAIDFIERDHAIAHKPKFILVSAFSDHDPRGNWTNTIDACLAKPITQASLCRAINTAYGVLESNQGAEEKFDISTYVDAVKDMYVLVVEDQDVNRDMIREILKTVGIEVDCAKHGKEALDMVQARPKRYDLVLMDLQMPVMDG
ncbi:MAG: response regulator, partial [Magnetovibrio sp.]|nr:response regulator [Magnetovibrio sp.]